MSTLDLTTTMNPPEIAVEDRPSRSGGKPRLAVVCCALPPQLDGIGDHSRGLAGALAAHADVCIHTVRGFVPDPIPGVQVLQSFGIEPRQSVNDLLASIEAAPPDWLILQYNPFCFGRRGFNPYLAKTVRRIKRNFSQTSLAVMVHEQYTPANSFGNALMWTFQRRQFAAITALADLTLFSTGPWWEKYRQRHSRRRSLHMPVGSNLRVVPADRRQVREELGLTPKTMVLGSFGSDHGSRLLGYSVAAGKKLMAAGHDVCLLVVGSAGPAFRSIAGDLPIIDLGPLPTDKVSRSLRAMDIFLSPFIDGVSTRRGSFFAALQHGLPIVTTRAYHTDPDLLRHDGRAFQTVAASDLGGFVDATIRLAGDPAMRQRLGSGARECSEAHYSLPVLTGRWLDALQIAPCRAAPAKRDVSVEPV
jgi:glycosyltransferase involved in cell wall biosynthesis